MDQSSITSPPEVVNAFASAIVTAFSELVSIEVQVEPLPLSSETKFLESAVSAVISLKREVPGEMNLIFSVDAAKQVAMRYLPSGTQLSEELINDVAGEFANVIAGQAKTILKGTPFHYMISTPVVTRQEVIVPRKVGSLESCEIRIKSELGPAAAIVQL